MKIKPVNQIQIGDLLANPVWEFTNDESNDETFVRPVENIPVSTLSGKIVGTQVLLGNGQRVWATVSNVDVNNPKATELFLTLSIERNGEWFMLARYFDFHYEKHGPDALAQFLGFSVDDVFPISYDLRQYATGEDSALAGAVLKEPRERLSRAEIISMTVRPRKV